jgi:small subunit ribosomal protein S16
MALKIRLRKQGRNNRPFYRVVVANERSPRDGKYVEAVGWYNPFETEHDKLLFVQIERLQYWLDRGAQLTETVESLISKVQPTLVRQQADKILARREKCRLKRRARKAAAV